MGARRALAHRRRRRRARARTERARDAWAEVTEERRAQLAARLMHEAHAVLDGLQAPVLVRQVVTLAGAAGEPARAEVVEVLLPGPTARDVRDRAQAAALLVDRMLALTGEGAADQEPDLDLEADPARAPGAAGRAARPAPEAARRGRVTVPGRPGAPFSGRCNARAAALRPRHAGARHGLVCLPPAPE